MACSGVQLRFRVISSEMLFSWQDAFGRSVMARLLGLLAGGDLALQSGILKHSEFDRIRRLGEALPVKCTLGSTKPWDILRALKYDSKAIIRTREIPLLVGVGEESPGEARDENQLTEAFRWVLEWAHGLSGLRRGGSTS